MSDSLEMEQVTVNVFTNTEVYTRAYMRVTILNEK